MPISPPSGRQLTLHQLMAMSTMLSPTHTTSLRPLIQAGGGNAASEVLSQQLYLSQDIQQRLRQIFSSLCGSDAQLSRQKFKEWLASVQSQPIDDLKKDEYKCEEFLEAIHYNYGFDIAKALKPDEKDLSHPISNYFISSSHNTYLVGNQLSSKSSTEAYRNVLIRGCRCIEIDVHNGENPETKSTDDSISTTSSSNGERRRLAGSTLSSRAAAAVERADEKIESAKQKFLKTRLGKDLLKSEDRERLSTLDSPLDSSSHEPPLSPRLLRTGEPLVLHGWTLTAPVGFRAVCQTIRETAFLTSSLPLIVSLEVHADLEQQETMVSIMKEEWKGLLIDVAHETCNPDERLPRLEELTGKILVKVKKATPSVGPDVNSLAPTSSIDPDSGQSGSEDERSSIKKKKPKICQSLSELGIYTCSSRFETFESDSAKSPPHVFSIGESQILELHESSQAEMFAHNRDFFMRAYPAGFRIDSSNLDPSVFWRKGVQMVALNWQKLDEGMMLNEGMFSGESGWVLKPPGYRSIDPNSKKLTPIKYRALNLKVTVFAGQHIPLPRGQSSGRGFHPYVKAELHVEKPEQRTSEVIEGGGRAKEGEYKQRTPPSKGDHPSFGNDGFVLEFPNISDVVEELSFLRFKIEDTKYSLDSLAAWACIRLDRLQNGYRFVNLLDSRGQATAGMIFLKIEKTIQ